MAYLCNIYSNIEDCSKHPICEYNDAQCKVSENYDIIKSNLRKITEEEDLESLDELVGAIFNLDIRKIVKSVILKKSFLEYLKTLKEDEREYRFTIYRTITSKYFLNELFPSFNLQHMVNILPASFKQKIFLIINSGNNISYKIYSMIYEVVYNVLKIHRREKQNTSSIVFKTAQNVDNSEIIQELGISSYKSILDNFSDFYIYDKKSASDTIIFSAELKESSSKSLNVVRSNYSLNKIKLFFKIYPKTIQDGVTIFEQNNYGLNFEKNCYVELFKLVKYNFTPNILCTVAVSENLSDFNSELNSEILKDNFKPFFKSNLKSQIEKLNEKFKLSKSSKWLNTNVTVTQTGGTEFSTIFLKLGLENGITILFQLFYTLYVFEQIEFSHGDLHLNNMFIINVPETELCYLVDGQLFKFTTIYLLKIYDFDLSLICKSTNINVNGKSKIINYIKNESREDKDSRFTTRFGLSNIFNNQYDIARVLILLTQRLFPTRDSDKKDKYIEFLTRIFPGSMSSKTIERTYNNYFSYDSDSDSNFVKSKEELLDNMKKANKIFDTKLELETKFLKSNQMYVDYEKYDIQTDILKMTWNNYFIERDRDQKVGLIIKSFEPTEKVNHLWIPDTIIIPKLEILKDELFNSLRSTEQIDIRNDIVYTIDDRIGRN
jgi:hypothetical protein